VFQQYNLLPGLTAVENVALPLELDGVGRRAAHRSAREMLAELGLAERADHYPDDLSGGESQRVAIARAMVGQRRIRLADEPTGALDSVHGEAVMRLLRTACCAPPASGASPASWSRTTRNSPPGRTAWSSCGTAGSSTRPRPRRSGVASLLRGGWLSDASTDRGAACPEGGGLPGGGPLGLAAVPAGVPAAGLMVALLTVAVAAAVGATTVTYHMAQPDEARFGGANTRISLDPRRLADDLALIEAQTGAAKVIGHRYALVPGGGVVRAGFPPGVARRTPDHPHPFPLVSSVGSPAATWAFSPPWVPPAEYAGS